MTSFGSIAQRRVMEQRATLTPVRFDVRPVIMTKLIRTWLVFCKMSDDDYCSCGDPRETASAPQMELMDRVRYHHHLGRPPAYTSQSCVKLPRINLLLWVGVAELVLSALLLYGGITCELYTDGYYCSYYSVLWMPSLCLLNSVVGVVAAIVRHDTLLFVHLVASVVAITVATASAVISLFDYKTIGTDQWTTKHDVFCILSNYDPRRIQHIYKDSRHNDFAECIWQFKLGLSVIILTILGAFFLAALNTLSIVLCAKRIRQWPRFSHR